MASLKEAVRPTVENFYDESGGGMTRPKFHPPMPRGPVRAADQVGNPFFDKVAARVRGARLAAGWKRSKLSDETGIIPAQRLAEKEYNLRPFNLMELRRISLVLGVPIEKFFQVDREGNEDIWAIPLGEEDWYWRVTAADEKNLLEAYRKLKNWQRRSLLLMTKSLELQSNATDAAHDDKQFSWTNPENAARAVVSAAMKLWPDPGKDWLPPDEEEEATAAGKVPDWDAEEEEMVLAMTGAGLGGGKGVLAGVAEVEEAVEEEEDYGVADIGPEEDPL